MALYRPYLLLSVFLWISAIALSGLSSGFPVIGNKQLIGLTSNLVSERIVEIFGSADFQLLSSPIMIKTLLGEITFSVSRE